MAQPEQADAGGSPIDRLLECHDRVGEIVDRISEMIGTEAPLGRDDRQELRALDADFLEESRLHRADEEDSLFPRVLRRADADLVASIRRLTDEHGELSVMYAEVQRRLRMWLSRGELSPDDSGSLSRAMSRMRALVERHGELEEDVVFPAAARLLDEGDLREIASEMDSRRGVAG